MAHESQRVSWAWRRRVADGALISCGVWLVEVAAAAAVNADIGGWAVLASVAPALAAWGLAYAALGAVAGGLIGRWSGAVWLAVLAVGDAGVAPWPVHAGLILLGWALGLGASRLLGERAWAPVGVWLVVALTVASVGRAPVLAGQGDGPDVLLVVVDTLRRDHVGAYGYSRDTTPVIDALAAQGTRYSRARATSSWTLPSHASLFTGELPSVHGVTEGDPLLRPGTPTLASRLGERGYARVGYSANAWVSAGTGLHEGFDAMRFLGDEGIVSQLVLPLAVARPVDLGSAAIVRAFRADVARAQGPVFAFVNLLEAHEPFGTLPEGDLNVFASEPLDPLLGRVWVRDMPRFWCRCARAAGELACVDGQYRANETRIRGVIDRYDAGIRYADRQIRALVEAMEARGRPLIVVVTSDHGERLGEQRQLGHMVWLDDVLLDVPLVVRAPGLAVGVDDTPLTLADVPGLVLALVDGEPRPPPPPVLVAESHPHRPSTLALWETAFDCDFSPARAARRMIWSPARALRLDGGGLFEAPPGGLSDAERAWVEAPFHGTTEGELPMRRALEVLGYVE